MSQTVELVTMSASITLAEISEENRYNNKEAEESRDRTVVNRQATHLSYHRTVDCTVAFLTFIFWVKIEQLFQSIYHFNSWKTIFLESFMEGESALYFLNIYAFHLKREIKSRLKKFPLKNPKEGLKLWLETALLG